MIALVAGQVWTPRAQNRAHLARRVIKAGPFIIYVRGRVRGGVQQSTGVLAFRAWVQKNDATVSS